jgi:molecular chaperone DnaK
MATRSGPDERRRSNAVTALRDRAGGRGRRSASRKDQDLMQASMKLGEAMYKAQQEETAHADAAKHAAKDDVVDADFKEVKDDKKGA